MPCSKDRRVLFVHIPKTGGTSVEKAFGWHGPWDVENKANLFGLIQSPEFLDRPWSSDFLQHLTWREIQSAFSFHEPLIFAVVRNPWARFASVYFNTDSHLKQMAAARGIDLERLSFDAFIDATENLEHAHLRPQFDYLCSDSGSLVVKELLHTESLARDFSDLCSRSYLKAYVVEDLPWANSSARRYPLDQLYTPGNWHRIARRYAIDLEFLKLREDFVL
jgi:hypothetical protein